MAPADRNQPPDQPPLHVRCANAGGGDADQGDDQKQNAATAQCVGKAGSAPSDTVLCSRYKQANLFLEIPLDGHVFVDRGIREGSHEHLASVPGKEYCLGWSRAAPALRRSR
jgi:hypothetical protein